MSKILAILGAGELGKQIANFAITDKHYKEVLFYDDSNTDSHVKGTSESLLKDFNDKKFDELIIGIGYNHLEARKKRYEYFRDKIPFGKIVHSSSWVDVSAKISEGCIIYPKCTIDKNVQINANTILNLNCTIAHDTSIGAHSFLAPTVSVAGFCTIGNGNFIGIGTIIKDTVTLSDFVQTGAGTVVIKEIKETGIYVGNPARKL